jgi:hypothetical protein
MTDLHSEVGKSATKKMLSSKKKKVKKGIQHFSEPADQVAPEEESVLPSIKKKKFYKEDI